jgi:hypothetical protein
MWERIKRERESEEKKITIITQIKNCFFDHTHKQRGVYIGFNIKKKGLILCKFGHNNVLMVLK